MRQQTQILATKFSIRSRGLNLRKNSVWKKGTNKKPETLVEVEKAINKPDIFIIN